MPGVGWWDLCFEGASEMPTLWTRAARWMAPAVPVFASKAGSYPVVVWFA